MPLERNDGTRKDKRIMLTIRQKGDFSKLTKYLIKAKEVAKFDSVLATWHRCIIKSNTSRYWTDREFLVLRD